MFSVVMFIRMIVKLVYFYVEFYISGWALNVFVNLAMDSTYVISMFWLARLISKYSGVALRWKKLLKAAGVCFVAGFLMISLFAVDRNSNHLIVIEGEVPTFLYTVNEMFYLGVALSVGLAFLPGVIRMAAGRGRKIAMAAVVLFALYSVWVFLWNVSFVFPPVEVIRQIKPFDGVHFFALAAIVMLPLLAGIKLPGAQEKEQPAVLQDKEHRVEAFADAHALTAREREVLALTYQGMSSAQVSEALYISLNTAKRHIYNIYKKCSVNNKYELIYQINNDTPEDRFTSGE